MKLQNKKRKICFIIFAAYPLFNSSSKSIFGGAELNLYNLALKLSENPENSITFCVGDYGQKYIEYYNGIKVKKIAYQNLQKYKKWHYKILRYLYLFKELLFLDTDVMITTTASELLGWMAIILKGIRRKKIIFRLASDEDTNPCNFRYRGHKFPILYNFGIRHTDIITCQTDRQASLLKKSTGLDGIVVKNGFFLQDENAATEKEIILWVSRDDRMKRPELFVKMAEELSAENFVMIMPSSGVKNVELFKRISKLKNMEHIDYVPFREIHKYYEKAKLFVNTSEFEGFPNSFIQACLSCTPILSFKVDPDFVITKNDMGFLCDDSLDTAVRFVKGLTDERIKIMGDNALKYVRMNHNIEQSARKYTEIIKSLSLATRKNVT